MRRENKRKGLNRLLVLVLAAAVTMAFSFTSISFAAEETEGGSTATQVKTQEVNDNDTLPREWSNIANIKGRVDGYYLDLDNSKKLDIEYRVQVSSASNPDNPDNGKIVDPKHIVKQYIIYNGQQYDNVSEFSAQHPGKGELVTKWDNNRIEYDGFSFYTHICVMCIDEDTNQLIPPWKSVDTIYYNPNNDAYDLSSRDKPHIRGYRYVQTEGNLTGKISELTGQYTVNVLYKKQFTVTYKDGVGGEVFPDQTKTVDRNAKTPAFEGKTEREGYSFIGWDKEIAPAVTDNVVYTAQWKENSAPYVPVTPSTPTEEHTVTFHPNNGESNFTQTVPDGGKAVQPEDPAQEGYTFDGWFTDSSFTQKYDFNTPVKGNIDLYAKWNKVVKPVNPVKPVKPSRKVTGILLPKVIAKGKHTQTLTWTALKNVDGYFIYTNHCDEAQGRIPHPFKKVADYKSSKARVYTKKNLKTYHNYKYYVAAYKIKNGKKVIVRNSVTVHSVCGNTSARSTNVKSVKVSKHAVTLKKGQTYKVKASISKLNKKRAFLDATHCGLLRYLTADSNIATVNYKTGMIKAKKAGKTTVYVLGVNGIRDKVTVTVK